METQKKQTIKLLEEDALEKIEGGLDPVTWAVIAFGVGTLAGYLYTTITE